MKLQFAAYALRTVRRAERIRWPHVEVRDVVLVLLLAASFLFQAHDQNKANHSWCSTLDLLTSHPVPKPADPAANPSREQTYRLYSVFVTQRHRLGCG